jgi:DNA-binding NtrC family response regulator/pSer/pThr/pTyr-binding forkhead associated (FHA) protein
MSARLIVERGNAEPAVLDLETDGVVRLGRNQGNNIQIKDQYASRSHAEIACDAGRWVLRECQTTNATVVNGQRISGPTPLEDGALIDIGDTRLRFRVQSVDDTPESPLPEPPDDAHTVLMTDELTALVRFMEQALQEETPQGLIRLALNVVRELTSADVAGFLTLDADDPEPRIVVPARSSVNARLSRQLTRLALETKRPIWMGSGTTRVIESDSLLDYNDAVCVPLFARRPGEPAAGAMHVYRASRPFTTREFGFCEVLAGHLAGSLLALRARLALEAENSRLQSHPSDFGDVLVGDSPVMVKLRETVRQLADAPCPVLILGESGVGKELVALALHRGVRQDAALVKVNAATIVSTLAESQLFGHEHGAFSGADRRHRGLFQQADGGTLFFDEIGDLSPECQAKLLRVLEDFSFQPVGAEAPMKVNARVVAATNRNLEADMRAGRFRSDLFFRLGTKLRVPPLREHREDVPALAAHFLGRLNAAHRKQISLAPASQDRLQTFDWPGNVRQLRSVLETAFYMAKQPSHVIQPGEIHLDDVETAFDCNGPTSLKLADVEAWAIRQVVSRTRTNVEAAEQLGINRDTLLVKMKKYAIERGKE